MELWRVFWVFGLWVVWITGQLQTPAMGSSSCDFPAIYNFGDSNSATSSKSTALDGLAPPLGETLVGKFTGRSSDGRVIIDFMAEALGLPYLSAYRNSTGTCFRHGANFAVGGASIRPGGFSPFNLGVQLSEFLQFKADTHELRSTQQGKNTSCKSNLDFSKALYTLDIGQNDLGYGFQHMSEDEVRASIPDILDQFSSVIQRLYKEGARAFWVHNTGPIGCLPYSVIYYPSKPGNLDKNGCVRPQNEVAQDFNRQLKDRLTQLKAQLPLAAFTYVDVYTAKYELISNAKSQGFVDPLKFCCGSYYGYHVDCGTVVVVNGTVYGKPCKNRKAYISWDGIHYSEEANRRVANRIVNGSISDPPISITQACHNS